MSKTTVLNDWLDLANEDAKTAFDSQTYAYYPRLTEDKISQQSADQLPMSHINPVEFDGFRMKTKLWSPEQEERA